MNNVLAGILDNYSPKFNKNITQGCAKELLRTLPNYLNGIFKSSIRSLAPNVPLTYVGYRRMLPDEEFDKIITSESNKTTYDIAISDLYVVEYVFDYNGQEIRRPLYLPYVNKGNLLRISETYYNIVPILSDTVITPSYKDVFVRLLKDKMSFKRKDHNILVNNEKIPGQIIYLSIVKMKNSKVSDNSEFTHALTSASLYILGKYGIKEAIKRYLKDDRYIITTDNVDKYRKDYNVYESTQIKPKVIKLKGYTGHNLKICIHKDIQSVWLENFIYGIIYTFDLVPQQVEDFMECYTSNNVKDEKFFWRIILARIAYRNEYSIEKLAQEMKDHFNSLESYLDTLIQIKLAENKIYCENFYDLMAYIMENFNIMLLRSKEYTSDINNRYIDILYYLAYEIIIGFNKAILAINKRASKKTNDILTYKEVKMILSTEFKTRAIFSLVKSSAMNIAIHLSDPTSDIIYPKITALLDDQDWSLSA